MQVNKIEIVTHYEKGDEEYRGDYGAIDIYIDGVQVIEYGDYYHDCGDEKAKGFLNAIQYLFPKVKVIQTNVADMQY